eukprot:5253801-Lingulodinium_polyedra.AAC.1
MAPGRSVAWSGCSRDAPDEGKPTVALPGTTNLARGGASPDGAAGTTIGLPAPRLTAPGGQGAPGANCTAPGGQLAGPPTPD